MDSILGLTTLTMHYDITVRHYRVITIGCEPELQALGSRPLVEQTQNLTHRRSDSIAKARYYRGSDRWTFRADTRDAVASYQSGPERPDKPEL